MKNVESEFLADPLFAAANTSKGFKSFYSEIFKAPSVERRYIIKGGPGTGKSSFMKKIDAEAIARGSKVARYRCSSDPDSLDGIVIDGKVAVIDGTAPHSEDTELAGARDEIIDLGAFWNSEALRKRRTEIERLSEKKSDCYRRAYRFLSACEELFLIDRSLVLKALKREKLERAVGRILSSVPRGEGARITTALACSFGMRGRVRFDSYERSAEKLYVIDDVHRTGHLFLRALITGALQRECPICVSYDPIHVSEPDAVYFCHTGDCFVIGDGEERDADVRINMKRFVSAEGISEIRKELRSNKRVYEAMLSSAEETLARAGEYHFALEEIYSSAMDFEAQNAFCDELIKKIFNVS